MNPISKITPTEWAGERKSKWYTLRQGIMAQAPQTSQTYHLSKGVNVDTARKIAYGIAKQYGYRIRVSVVGNTLNIYKKGSDE